jgi:Zn-dependent protease with chaperone function
MTMSLVLLCVAAASVIAFVTSALVGLALVALRRPLSRLSAAAQARVLLGAALLPAFAVASVMTAALAPSFGWIIDHCAQPAKLHQHPHICADHHDNVFPTMTVVFLASLLACRLLWSGVRLARGTFLAAFTRRQLARVATRGDEREMRVLPFDEPQAFVVGAVRPMLFVTQGLLSSQHREHLAPVLSHERAHVRRRDPLRRAVAMIVLGFHLPGIARWIEARLARAHEMAADAEAAREIGSGDRVVNALVALIRAQRPPLEGMAFGGSDLELRIASLLDSRPKNDRPHRAVLLAAAGCLIAIVCVSADEVHHGVEIMLGLINH